MVARIEWVDRQGPPANQELFRWLEEPAYRGFRLCEYKVHHPRACRAYVFLTERGFVIARIADKTTNAREFNKHIEAAKRSIDSFIEEGARYE